MAQNFNFRSRNREEWKYSIWSIATLKRFVRCDMVINPELLSCDILQEKTTLAILIRERQDNPAWWLIHAWKGCSHFYEGKFENCK